MPAVGKAQAIQCRGYQDDNFATGFNATQGEDRALAGLALLVTIRLYESRVAVTAETDGGPVTDAPFFTPDRPP
jgi:hypothetical protein